MAIDEQLIDKRIVQRSIKKGLVTQTAVQDYLRALPDKSGQIAVPAAAATSDAGERGPTSSGT